MANLVDLYLVYRILRRLTQPFTEWEAYKQGVIDAEGNILKKSNDRLTFDEKESFTKFDLLILKLKKLLGTIPFGKTKLASYVAALWFLKEEKKLTEDNLQEEFEKFCIKEKMLSEKLEDFYSKKNPPPMHHVIRNYYHLTDRGYKEHEINNYFNKTFGMKLKKGDIEKHIAKNLHSFTEEVAANAVGGGAIAGTDDNPPVGKKAQQKYTKRFANNDVFVVSSETYNKARLGKRKFIKYETYVGNDEIGNAIREYGRKYPKKPIILQDGENGPMIFLRRGRNTFKEHLELTENVSQSDLKGVEKV